MSNESFVLVDDKKKAKKWQKKVEKGEIQSATTYFTSKYLFGIQGKPTINYLPDKSRNNCHYQLHIQELRDLFLSCLNHEKAVPRYFEITNRAYIRYVLYIHLMDVENTSHDLQDMITTPIKPYRMLLTKKNPDELMFLPHKLLTIPISDAEPEELFNISGLTSNNTSKEQVQPSETPQDTSQPHVDDERSLTRQAYQAYVLSTTQRSLWNYPMPVILSNEPQNPPDALVPSTNDSDASQDLDLDEIDTISDNNNNNNTNNEGSVGAKIITSSILQKTSQQLLPSLEETHAITSQLTPRSIYYYKDFPTNQHIVTKQTYFETISETNPLFRQILWPQLSSEESIPIQPLTIAAIDCEMVETKHGLELCRVTILDEFNVIRFDQLVKPTNDIVNYHTQFSGMTYELLKDIQITLEQVQIALLRLISAETIIIGHSLDSDLKAMHLFHLQVIDTAIVFPHPHGFPVRYKLKQLAKDLLQLNIQNPKQRQGHDSVEDARTTLQLLLRKLEEGPLFGVKGNRFLRVPLANRLCCQGAQLSYGWLANSSVEPPSSTSSTIGQKRKYSSIANQTSPQFNIQYLLENLLGSGEIHTCRNTSIQELFEETITFLQSKEGLLPSKPNHQYLLEHQHAIDPLRFAFVNVKVTSENKEQVKQMLEQTRVRLQESQSHRGLMVVTSQPSFESIVSMQDRKRICSTNVMTTNIWTAKQEEELLVALNKINVSQVTFVPL